MLRINYLSQFSYFKLHILLFRFCWYIFVHKRRIQFPIKMKLLIIRLINFRFLHWEFFHNEQIMLQWNIFGLMI